MVHSYVIHFSMFDITGLRGVFSFNGLPNVPVNIHSWTFNAQMFLQDSSKNQNVIMVHFDVTPFSMFTITVLWLMFSFHDVPNAQ